MKKTIICTAILMAASATAWAQTQPAVPAPPATPPAAAPAAGAPDMSKMGPMSRPVTKEDKKGVEAAFKAMDEAWKSGSIEAVAEHVDFPVIMLSDDSKGEAKSFNADRAQWTAMMGPMVANMPKDIKFQHKHDIDFLSDTLAVAVTDTKMKMGKNKGQWKGLSVLTLRDGKWKFKQMAEAGWGDTAPPQTAAAAKR